MCGRHRLLRRKQIIEERFATADWQDDWSPRYKIAPTRPVPVIRQHPKEPARQITALRWGLIPYWAKDPSITTNTINAKSETAATKPAFRDPLKLRRNVIPADGFYEWRRKATSKQPYCFQVNDGELFAFAGSWDGWNSPEGQWINTCSILTTTSNAVTPTVHDRMPVIPDPRGYDLWRDAGMHNIEAISKLLKPCDARLMRAYPIRPRINHVANDGEECSRPVEVAEPQSNLFRENKTGMKIAARVSNMSSGHTVEVETEARKQSIVIAPKSVGRGSSINGGELLFADSVSPVLVPIFPTFVR